MNRINWKSPLTHMLLAELVLILFTIISLSAQAFSSQAVELGYYMTAPFAIANGIAAFIYWRKRSLIAYYLTELLCYFLLILLIARMAAADGEFAGLGGALLITFSLFPLFICFLLCIGLLAWQCHKEGVWYRLKVRMKKINARF